MRVRPGAEYLLWSFAGLVLLSLLIVVVWHLRPDESPAQQLALKASRVDLVSRMQVALASSSEAERSAVLATTDEDSQAFAAQALAAVAEVERARAELVPFLTRGDLESERALLAQFSEEFANSSGSTRRSWGSLGETRTSRPTPWRTDLPRTSSGRWTPPCHGWPRSTPCRRMPRRCSVSQPALVSRSCTSRSCSHPTSQRRAPRRWTGSRPP